MPVLHSRVDSSSIRRLNSTLSIRIEELNAKISALYLQNLHMRASEIALSVQLKRECKRTKSLLNQMRPVRHSKPYSTPCAFETVVVAV